MQGLGSRGATRPAGEVLSSAWSLGRGRGSAGWPSSAGRVMPRRAARGGVVHAGRARGGLIGTESREEGEEAMSVLTIVKQYCCQTMDNGDG